MWYLCLASSPLSSSLCFHCLGVSFRSPETVNLLKIAWMACRTPDNCMKGAGTIAYQRPANLAGARRRARRCSLLVVFSLGTCCFACQPPYSSEFLFASSWKYVHLAHSHACTYLSLHRPHNRSTTTNTHSFRGGNIMNLSDELQTLD